MDAAVIDKFARVGDKASAKLSPDKGLASLGTIIDDPGRTVLEALPKRVVVGFIVLPFGKMINVFFSAAFCLKPPAKLM